MNLCRLIYKSKTSWDVITNESLKDLAIKSAARNEGDDISGLLILSGESFLQVLEGPGDAVNRLYGKIIRDEMHSDVNLLSYEQASSRSFAEWSMRVVDLNDMPMVDRVALRKKYTDREGYIDIPDDLYLAIALLFDARALCLAEG